MNLILFDAPQAELLLPHDDPRALHLRNVLRRQAGDQFDAAAVNGPRGKGTLLAIEPDGLRLAFHWSQNAEDDRLPIHLLLGLPRPQTARKVLEQTAAQGVRSITFFEAEKGEPSYAQSRLWSTDEWSRLLRRGVEQAFCAFLPEVFHHPNLPAALAAVQPNCNRLALDVYEADQPLAPPDSPELEESITLAIGPERGWSLAERNHLRAARFTLRHLGTRVLRTETACIAALGILAVPHW